MKKKNEHEKQLIKQICTFMNMRWEEKESGEK
jgi:hypothetical protein